MRSSVPIPGNPWPHDMLITVEDNPHALVDLLWIREAWNLQPAANDLPPLLSDESVKTTCSNGIVRQNPDLAERMVLHLAGVRAPCRNTSR